MFCPHSLYKSGIIELLCCAVLACLLSWDCSQNVTWDCSHLKVWLDPNNSLPRWHTPRDGKSVVLMVRRKPHSFLCGHLHRLHYIHGCLLPSQQATKRLRLVASSGTSYSLIIISSGSHSRGWELGLSFEWRSVREFVYIF